MQLAQIFYYHEPKKCPLKIFIQIFRDTFYICFSFFPLNHLIDFFIIYVDCFRFLLHIFHRPHRLCHNPQITDSIIDQGCSYKLHGKFDHANALTMQSTPNAILIMAMISIIHHLSYPPFFDSNAIFTSCTP